MSVQFYAAKPCRRRALASAAVAVFFISIRSVIAAGITITDTIYHRENSKTPAIEIDTDYYRAILVPELGGRILDWVDKTTGTKLAYDNDYGGLLDDHEGRINMRYNLEWLERSADIAVAQLESSESVKHAYTPSMESKFLKTVTFHASRPIIEVSYDISNLAQEDMRLLFRNVVRPGGRAFTGDEIYCYSLVTGLRRDKVLPTKREQAAPWCALVDIPSKTVVANAFEGDILDRFYIWRGSRVAPTYEFMFPPLKAGHRVEAKYIWSFTHGLSAVDYAHKTFVSQLEGSWDGGRMTARMDLVATYAPMPELEVKAEILNPERGKLAESALTMPVSELAKVNSLDISQDVASDDDYIILLLTLAAPAIGGEPVVFEKPFARQGREKSLSEYRQPVRFIGAPVRQTPVEGWAAESLYTVRPDDKDRERGYLVFEEVGERSGRHTTSLRCTMAGNEPEAFPLRVASLNKGGKLDITATAPEGMSLETFIPESIPQTNWGSVKMGYKLHPGVECEIKPGDDRLIYFRLHTRDAPAGKHRGNIRVAIDGAEPTDVALEVDVRPIRFPESLYLVFDLNNLVNQLCARQIKGTDFVWDDTRAHNYLHDMASHGVRGQTFNGITSPHAHYYYNRVKLRESGTPLIDAIKANPERFRDTFNLPDLDFGYWDWLMDRLLEYGNSHIIIGFGIANYQQRHNGLTKHIYGRTLPDGDLRQTVIMEWYVGQLVRYLKDRGMPRILGICGDEIPGEQLGQWAQNASRILHMGMEPGVTQSVSLLRGTDKLHMVAPYMRYWIMGSFEKGLWDKRREEDIVKPWHWKTTYHSSANHWRPYANTRAICGLNSAFFDLDACWIQTYYRWRQSEAIIYPGDDGPISSAAWEGARDGLDDGNIYLLDQAMIAALHDRAARDAYREKLERVVGMRDDSLVRFINIQGIGTQTVLEKHDTAVFRRAKEELMALAEELAAIAPVQSAAATHGNRVLIAAGKPLFQIPAGLPMETKARGFLEKIAAPLAYTPAPLLEGTPTASQPVFFVGTRGELAERLPELAGLEALSDLNDNYPAAGKYVVRYATPETPAAKPGETPVKPAASLLVIAGDEKGADKGLKHLSNVITTPRYLYSHWLPTHWAHPATRPPRD